MDSRSARGCVTDVRDLLRAAMRDLSVPRPDWGCAARMLDWAATLCMELARDLAADHMPPGRARAAVLQMAMDYDEVAHRVRAAVGR